MASLVRRCAVVTLLLLSALGAESHRTSAQEVAPTIKDGTRVATTRTRHSRRVRRARRAPPGGVYARCAVVMDPVTGEVLYQKNADRSAPIASITKLMTAMVFLEQKPNLLRDVEVTREEIYQGGHTQLRNHEIVPLGDLLHMSLMCSDNVATRVLARESGLAYGDFMSRMNAKSLEIGLKDCCRRPPAIRSSTRSRRPRRTSSRPSAARTRSATRIGCSRAATRSSAARPATPVSRATASRPGSAPMAAT